MNRRFWLLASCCAVLLGLLGPSPGHAQSISSDRPGFGDGASTVRQGTLQAELGYQLTRANTNRSVVAAGRIVRLDVDETQHAIGQLILRYGATDALELRGGIGSYSAVSAEGEACVQAAYRPYPVDLDCRTTESQAANDGIATTIDERESGYVGAGVGPQPGATLGTKVRLFRNETAMLSALATTTLPLADDAFSGGDDRARQEIKLAFNGALGSSISLLINGGANFFWASGIQEDRAPVWLFTPSLTVGLSERVSAYVGYGGFYRDGPNQNFVEGALTLLPTANLQLDVNTGLRVDDNVDALFFVGLGLSHRF